MAERVQTGGLMTFNYGGKEKRSELSTEDKKEIREAYEKHYERKRQQKKKKMIWTIILLIIIFAIIIYAFSKI